MSKVRTGKLIVWSALVALHFAPHAFGVETVLVGSALPTDQGWTMYYTQGGTPDVSTDGSAVTLNTISELNTQLMFHKYVALNRGTYWVEFRLKVNSGTASHGLYNAPVAFFASYDPTVPSGTLTDRSNMVYFEPGHIGWGDESGVASVGTVGAFRTYRFEVTGPERTARVYVDGVVKLTRTGFQTNSIIAFGDMSANNGFFGSFSVESITVYRDCNGNNIDDDIEFPSGFPDCNSNERPDECDLENNDCNFNSVPDECDIDSGLSGDCNTNGNPDECDSLPEDGSHPVLLGNALPADQGWSMSTNQSLPDVTTDGSTITVNTVGTPEGGAARLIFYKDVGVGGKKYWVDIRLKLDALTALHNSLNAGLAFYGSFDPTFPSGSDANRSDMIFFDSDLIGFGNNIGSASVDTMSCFPTYRFDFSTSGNTRTVRVYMDGVLKFMRITSASLIPNGFIAFGDMTSDADLNSTFQIESIVVFRDCNGNSIEDSTDVANGASDCNSNDRPDECDADCNSNDIPDDCDLSSGTSLDCNSNAIPDECDILHEDCNNNLIPDSCEFGSTTDCDLSGVFDVCEIPGFDCNANQFLDSCDIASGFSQDADGNGYPDECPLTNPPAPTADPSGYQKTRFVSFVNPSGPVGATAIRIKMTSLHHVDPPYSGGPTIPFTFFEGQSVWVGPPANYLERSSFGPPFKAAMTQCSPHYRDWTTVGLLHVTGAHIVPSSVYEVEQVSVACRGSEESCAVISPRLEIRTTRWGDVENPYNPPTLTTQPNFEDVSELIDKFKCHLSCIPKARALLTGSTAFGEITPATLSLNFGFSHIAACIDAFKGKAYPSMMGKCAGPPFANSQCSGPANPQPCCTGFQAGSCNTSFSGACTADTDCTGPTANGAGPCNLYCP